MPYFHSNRYIHCTVNMSRAFDKIKAGLDDALAYAEGDPHAGRRLKPRGVRRKAFGIETRFRWVDTEWRDWFMWSRYESEFARDQAFDTLVNKNEREIYSKRQFRKVG